MRHLGFTGTRQGMTANQRAQVRGTIRDFSRAAVDPADVNADTFAHHGDCTGADAEFHRIVTDFGFRTVGHIPSDKTHRAFCNVAEERAPLPYMQRNRAIVTESELMIAAPAEMTEQDRGGTWATIRMARREWKPLAICYPDGSVATENWEWGQR